jgi:hypothetical protein
MKTQIPSYKLEDVVYLLGLFIPVSVVLAGAFPLAIAGAI